MDPKARPPLSPAERSVRHAAYTNQQRQEALLLLEKVLFVLGSDPHLQEYAAYLGSPVPEARALLGHLLLDESVRHGIYLEGVGLPAPDAIPEGVDARLPTELRNQALLALPPTRTGFDWNALFKHTLQAVGVAAAGYMVYRLGKEMVEARYAFEVTVDRKKGVYKFKATPPPAPKA